MNNFIGSIAGDVIGSVYEWENAEKMEDIIFFKKGTRFTDDTVLSCAVAKWLLETKGTSMNQRDILIQYLKKYGNKHPHAGYGGFFKAWLSSNEEATYGSYGNGSGMRVASCGFFGKTMEQVLDLAKKSAEVTHSHEEGIKGAQAIAAAIFLARSNKTKAEIRDYIEKMFGYRLDFTINARKGTHPFDATCQVTVPEAIVAFLEGESYEDVIKKAILVGGDSDTIACMAGGIAAAYYGVPSYVQEYVLKLLPDDLKEVVLEFDEKV